jgi:hypothetical protein
MGVLLFMAAVGAKDHRDRSLTVKVFAFVIITASYVSVIAPFTLIHAGSGRTCPCEPITAGAAGPRPLTGHRELRGD